MNVTVKRSEWLRGEGSLRSYLLRAEDGKRCCLGFVSQACGYSDADMVDMQTPAMMVGLDKPIAPELRSLFADTGRRHNSACAEAMYQNDDEEIGDARREALIRELLAPLGFNLTFVD